MYRKILVLFAVGVWDLSSLQVQAIAEAYPISPYPTSLKPGPGQFVLTPETGLVITKPAAVFHQEADYLRTLPETGLTASGSYRWGITPQTLTLRQ